MNSKMLSTLAIGAAAYFLRNKSSRDKVMSQIQSMAAPENIEKIKKQLPFLNTSSQGRSTRQFQSSEGVNDANGRLRY
ncbi:hypothetical protein JOC77_003999 [Peribacillus deserti]|uniref:YtxH domain-containing protein n=1 Tax=Peribacillus deserti TaxID=673318 RepID=A0ABS2QMZ1_9BACI|nr:hypothetical protein [Peribacillus deserti]MBM7694536.1 hypothetical protein [Peribacillus deserti]